MKIVPPKVLIVDDEPHVVEYVSEMLSSINFNVVASATNGVEASEKLYKYKPDMVILDITMPGMTGDEAIELLKEVSPNVIIVMLTSRNTIEMVKECKEKGIAGYILKSETGDSVCQKIQEIWFGQFFEGVS